MKKQKLCQVLVVGGGMSGICAAIAAAREGVKTILVHNRPVLGGNASSEIRMHICGADIHGKRPNARETGIIEELLLENKHLNPEQSYAMFDLVLWGKLIQEPNLTLLLNTHMTEAEVLNGEIKKIQAVQLTSEITYEISANVFIDATGDGMLGALSGAEFMYGREGKDIFGEEIAPSESDHCTMGSSLLFTARNMNRPVEYQKPEWAYTFDEVSLAGRDHQQISSGYWWIELGGDAEHVIYDAEHIRDELIKSVAGIWDHIKNGSDHGADNYVMDWMGFLPGKRESRRLLGDYVLTANDCIEAASFPDAVAYGGWNIDNHVVDGLSAFDEAPTHYYYLKDVYPIPYRALYSKNIKNLLLAGRAISCSHLAFASSRVMGTCAVVGQAVGKAAALAVQKSCYPKELGSQVALLQQCLIREDCFIPGVKNNSSLSVTNSCEVTASSCQSGFEAQEITTGQYRSGLDRSHCWKSNGISKKGEWIEIKFPTPVRVSEVRLIFDSNLSREITISISEEILARQIKGTPPEIVKDYDLELFCDGKSTAFWHRQGNYQRLNVFSCGQIVYCDRIRLTCYETHGSPDIAVFGVDVYS